jgi:hypothetical protein
VEVTSDGISDGLYLLTAVTALWFAVRALERERTRSAFKSGLGAGLCLGLGYLVRPDALITLAGIGLTFLGLVIVRLRRRTAWRPPFVSGLGLTLGFAVLMGPYVGLIGKLTNKPTGKGLMETLQGGDAQPSYFQRSSLNAGTVPLASWFDPATDGRRSKAGWALESLAAEYWKTAHYSLVIFTVIGLFAVRRRFADPRVALLLIFAVVDAAALWTLAWVRLAAAHAPDRARLVRIGRVRVSGAGDLGRAVVAHAARGPARPPRLSAVRRPVAGPADGPRPEECVAVVPGGDLDCPAPHTLAAPRPVFPPLRAGGPQTGRALDQAER